MGSRKRSKPPRRRERGLRRRTLLASGAVALAAATLGLWRLLAPRGRRPEQALEQAAPPRPPLLLAGVFPHDSLPLVTILVDAIVPRLGPHPAASEIDLWPRLERCIAASDDGPEPFRNHWRTFESELRRRVPFRAGRPDPEALHAVLEGWHRDYARQDFPSLESGYFEILRRNVLLAYYTSPEGWASVGYGGPVHRPVAEPGASHG